MSMCLYILNRFRVNVYGNIDLRFNVLGGQTRKKKEIKTICLFYPTLIDKYCVYDSFYGVSLILKVYPSGNLCRC